MTQNKLHTFSNFHHEIRVSFMYVYAYVVIATFFGE